MNLFSSYLHQYTNEVFVTVKNHRRYIHGVYDDCARGYSEMENNTYKLNVLTVLEQICLLCLVKKNDCKISQIAIELNIPTNKLSVNYKTIIYSRSIKKN